MKKIALFSVLVFGVAFSALALSQYVVNGDFTQGSNILIGFTKNSTTGTGWTGFSRISTDTTAKYNDYVSAYINSTAQRAVLSNIYSTNAARYEARGGQPIYQTVSIDAPGQYTLSFDVAKANSNWISATQTFDMWIVGNGYLSRLYNSATGYRYAPTMSTSVATMSSTATTKQMVLNVPAAGTYTIYFAHSNVTLSPSQAAVVALDNVSITPVQ